MRENKFRGISEKTGEFVYGGLVRANNDGCNCVAIKDTIYNINNGKVNLIPEIVKPETVGQYLEMKDENGQEIYEGDVFGTTDGDEWVIGRHIAKMDGETLSLHHDIIDVILGNIHQNPELTGK